MRKLVLAAGVLGLVTLASPAPASAHSSFFLSLGVPLPGFVFFVTPPPPPPPVVHYPAPTYYVPAPVVTPYCYRHDRGRHLGWYRHGRYRGYDYY